jgi:hypothetical protein
VLAGAAFGPLPLGFAMNIAFARKSPIACIGVVRCETRLPPNEGGNATLFAGVRFESGRHGVWYSTACRTRLKCR